MPQNTPGTIHSAKMGGWYWRLALRSTPDINDLRELVGKLQEEVAAHRDELRECGMPPEEEPHEWYYPKMIELATSSVDLRKLGMSFVLQLEEYRRRFREKEMWPLVLHDPIETTAPFLPLQFQDQG